MGDITDPNEQQSPSAGDDALATGNGNGIPGENRGVKRPRVSAAAGDDDDDDDDKPGRERRKIDIKFIQDKSRRHITFSKRKAGIMKKVWHNSPFLHECLYNTFESSRIVYPFVCSDLVCRLMSSLYSPALKCFSSSYLRLDWYIPSRPLSFNLSSLKLKARTSSRLVNLSRMTTAFTNKSGLS